MTPRSHDASVVGERRGQLRRNAHRRCRHRWLDRERAIDVAVFGPTLCYPTSAGFDEAGDVTLVDGDGVINSHPSRRDRVCGGEDAALPAIMLDDSHLADVLWQQAL